MRRNKTLMPAPITIKKYGNRRLYDTDQSCYITLDELAERIQAGAEVRVVDAKTNEDLTQATLTQIVIEGRGVAQLLPVQLLTQLIRLGDDALAEFFGRYVTGALELYLQAKRGVQTVASYNPFAAVPFAATDALARMWMSSPFTAPPPPPPRQEPPRPSAPDSDVAELRRELEELKQSMRRGSDDRDSVESRPRRRSSRKKRS